MALADMIAVMKMQVGSEQFDNLLRTFNNKPLSEWGFQIYRA